MGGEIKPTTTRMEQAAPQISNEEKIDTSKLKHGHFWTKNAEKSKNLIQYQISSILNNSTSKTPENYKATYDSLAKLKTGALRKHNNKVTVKALALFKIKNYKVDIKNELNIVKTLSLIQILHGRVTDHLKAKEQSKNPKTYTDKNYALFRTSPGPSELKNFKKADFSKLEPDDIKTIGDDVLASEIKSLISKEISEETRNKIRKLLPKVPDGEESDVSDKYKNLAKEGYNNLSEEEKKLVKSLINLVADNFKYTWKDKLKEELRLEESEEVDYKDPNTYSNMLQGFPALANLETGLIPNAGFLIAHRDEIFGDQKVSDEAI